MFLTINSLKFIFAQGQRFGWFKKFRFGFRKKTHLKLTIYIQNITKKKKLFEKFKLKVYKIPLMPSQKRIVVSQNDNKGVFRSEVLFKLKGQIKRQRCADL